MINIEECFRFSPADMKKMIGDFHSEMGKGLSGAPSSLKMIPAYVRRPTGMEEGSILALDLGGTNFRILKLELKGSDKAASVITKKLTLTRKLITGTEKNFFDFLASRIKSFVKEHGIDGDKEIALGFTFSFPVEQTGIARGRLLRWTKGFNVKGVLGQDVVGLFNAALVRNGIGNIKVSALVNDTVGTLVAGSYADSSCDVGVIIGTGTNACYYEELKNIAKMKDSAYSSAEEMAVNIEWGNFNKLRRNIYDRRLDKNSDRPGNQILEKMVSGMYLGELSRIVFKDLVKRKALFGGHYAPAVSDPDKFKSEYMSAIEEDASSGLSGVDRMLKKIGVRKSTLQDRALVKKICGMVSLRASRVSASAIASVITKRDPRLLRNHTVAIDGSVYEKHPGFARHVRAALEELFGRSAEKIKIELTKDGSGKGAAIVVAVSS